MMMTRILCRPVCTRGHRLVIDLLWEPRDLWLGAFWRHHITTAGRHYLVVYLCLWPCLLLRVGVVLWRTRRSWEQIAEDWDED